MPNSIMIVLGVAVCAAVFCVVMMRALITEHTHPAWFWVILGFSLLMFVVLTLGFLPRPEERLADRLGRDSTAVQTTARIVALDRRGAEEGHTMHRTGLTLTLAVKEHGGSERAAKLIVWVEDALLPSFATGETIHVLYDPEDPAKLAIDRRHTPVQVQ
ncbi:DUF3592 domain-containing protein [Pollutimonas harenae]|uniref:DUF3592 domain-containing protein n=1 Tax=Pollutimonas harenae TaxID=657015 RepID=A0A853H387_9BURK|nr:DUF3592 domain-containing protein [Pollutimonas harenae]NYT86490.1 hypothetical protein [Pollutimonas harenae]TEA69765.1 hypothetical protein ERD84_13565 [Pollutimonas harenae]